MTRTTLSAFVIALLMLSACSSTPNSALIHDKAAHGHDEAIASIADADPAAVNSLNAQGLTPLHLAARNGHADTVAALVNRHADVDARTPDGSTALHLAAAGGHRETAQKLLQGGADPRITNQAGDTPAMVARRVGHVKTAAMLDAAASTF